MKDCLKVACPNCKPSIENYCINCEYANFIIDKDNQIYKLEKENAELKSEIKQIIERERVVPEHYLCEMIEKNKRQKAQITELEKRINTLKIKNASLQKKNEQQAKQIEKMKCCGNCINRGLQKYIAYPCSECKLWHREKPIAKWELAE